MSQRNVFRLLAAIVLCTAAACSEDRKLPDANARFLWISPAGENSRLPNLFTGPKGGVYMSWVEDSNGTVRLLFSTVKESGWSKPVPVASSDRWFLNWADYPIISGDDEGTILVQIPERSSEGKMDYVIRSYVSLDSGKSWNNTFLINDDKKGEHGFISSQPVGRSMMTVWLDGRHAVMEDHPGHGGRMTLRAALFSNVGIREREWELDSMTCDCCQTAAVKTSDGLFVVYRDRSADEVRDITGISYRDTTWSAPVKVSNDGWVINGCPVNGPAAAVSGNTIAVAWYSAPGNNAQVNLNFSSDNGKNFSQPVRIDGGDATGRVDVVCLDKDHFVVSWMEGDLIFVRMVTSDGKVGLPIRIAKSSTDRGSGFPQMEVAGDGILLAWTDIRENRIKTGSLGTRALMNSILE